MPVCSILIFNTHSHQAGSSAPRFRSDLSVPLTKIDTFDSFVCITILPSRESVDSFVGSLQIHTQWQCHADMSSKVSVGGYGTQTICASFWHYLGTRCACARPSIILHPCCRLVHPTRSSLSLDPLPNDCSDVHGRSDHLDSHGCQS